MSVIKKRQQVRIVRLQDTPVEESSIMRIFVQVFYQNHNINWSFYLALIPFTREVKLELNLYHRNDSRVIPKYVYCLFCVNELFTTPHKLRKSITFENHLKKHCQEIAEKTSFHTELFIVAFKKAIDQYIFVDKSKEYPAAGKLWSLKTSTGRANREIFERFLSRAKPVCRFCGTLITNGMAGYRTHVVKYCCKDSLPSCTQCPYKTKNLSSWILHSRKHPRIRRTPKPGLYCRFCNVTLPYMEEMHVHVLRHFMLLRIDVSQPYTTAYDIKRIVSLL